MPVHHLLEQILNYYIQAIGLRAANHYSRALILPERQWPDER
jgi:hypothetical protein